MNNQFKNKIDGCGTTPKFNAEMFFCVQKNTSPVSLGDCSLKEISQGQTRHPAQGSKEESIEVNLTSDHNQYQDRLIQIQDERIKALEKQITHVEQELYERDREIEQLENDLEEVCEELFLEVNLR